MADKETGMPPNCCDSAFTSCTQPFSQGSSDSPEVFYNAHSTQQKQVWGYLAGQSHNLPKMFYLDKEVYKFGRCGKCDLTFEEGKHGLEQSTLQQISKEHFLLYQFEDNVILEDKSTNGTYVNGLHVGGSELIEGQKKKVRKVVLQAFDRISLISPNGPSFLLFLMKVNEHEKDMPLNILDRYRILGLLGSGGSATVHLAKELNTCKTFALKKIDKNYSKPGMNSEAFIKNEIKILKSIDFVTIVKVEDIIDLDHHTFIVMEYMAGGSLANQLKSNAYKPICEPICKIYFYQLLLALQYLEAKSIIHRDIKPENILMCGHDHKLKLADFGLSKLVSQSCKAVTCCGSYDYVAPEVIKSDGKEYTAKVDIWSLGVTLYYCLSGRLPFVSKDTKTLKQLVLSGTYSLQGPEWDRISEEAKSVIKRMLTVNPEERGSAKDLLGCSWFDEKVFQVVKKRLPPPIFNNNDSSPMAKRMHIDGKAHCSKENHFIPLQPR